nr:putative reverse transcriptase domain-containing protein [Tanacetum cinerariifolium]
MIREMTEKIVQIKNRLLTARSSQKSYADRRSKPLKFEVDDMVLLKVSPWKGAMRFEKRGKLHPRYIRPFKILARVGHVAYTLELPEELKGIHSTFHVLNLKKWLAKGDIVVPMDEIQLDDKLHMIEEPTEIIDREVKRLKQSQIPIVKELPDIDSIKDIHPYFDDDPLSGSTTYSANSLLEEFADELALISYPPDYDDNRACDIESDIREIEFFLFQGADSDFKDSINQSVLTHCDDLFVDPTPEMFTEEQPPDYSFPPRFNVYPDDFLEIESDNTFDDDSFDFEEEKIKEAELLIDPLDLPCDILFEYDSFNSHDFFSDDVLPSPDNEDKVFNLGILSHEKSVLIITQEKKHAISFASWLFEDFDPLFYELLVFKEVPNSMRLLPFSSENEEKVFKPGIYTFKKFHCCFLFELSHP